MSFGTFIYSISRNKLMEFSKLKMCPGMYIKFHPNVLLALEKHFRMEVAIGSYLPLTTSELLCYY